jgi:hypothetical protein
VRQVGQRIDGMSHAGDIGTLSQLATVFRCRCLYILR